MKKLNNLNSIILFLIALFIFGCTSVSERDKDAAAINDLEEELKKETARPEKAELDNLLNLYTSFVDKYPEDTASATYLYRAVNLSMGMNQPQMAMKLVDRTLNEYQKSPHLAETVFLKAYIYENFLGNLGTASGIYRDFIHRFPEHELADDAQAAITNMGKSPEELVKEFESRNQN